MPRVPCLGIVNCHAGSFLFRDLVSHETLNSHVITTLTPSYHPKPTSSASQYTPTTHDTPDGKLGMVTVLLFLLARSRSTT